MKKLLIVPLSLLLFGCSSSKPAVFKWHEIVEMDLKAMGEANWIVAAQSAQPHLTNPAYETVTTDESFLYIVKHLRGEINDAGHLRAVVYRESELDRIQERDAPGVEAFREKLAKLLYDSEVKVLPRAEIEEQLKTAAKTHRVLFVKSEGVMPYGNVYFKLLPGYWDETREKRLREAIKMAD